VAGGLAFRVVSAGVFFSCGVTTDNTAYCWGSNQEGTLGIGTSIGPEGCTFDMHCSTSPVRVLGQRAYRSVSGAGEHACGATFESGVYCWGFNLNGELGGGTEEGPESCDRGTLCSSKPVPVAAPKT
jgi:alpha-tubulin suppressor-like RCC1 family protein